MRHYIMALLAAVLLAGTALAQEKERNKAPRFEPAEVASADKVIRPYNSVAFGTVLVQVTVNAAGDAEEITVTRGIPSLTEAALESIKRWKFIAAKLDGKPVRSATQVAFVFVPPMIGAGSRAITRSSAEAPVTFEPARVITPDETMYPPLSIAAGTVVLQVAVSPAGDALDTKVLRGTPSLTEQALRSVKKWTFAAAKLDGRPVRSTVHIAYVFTPPVTDP